MQEGAGVRQIIEDELRRAGTRLRDLDVRLELGLQESVRSAVQAGYGVTFISRSAVEPELAAGTLARPGSRGSSATREISLVRATGRVATRVADAFVEFARATPVIVRWGLEELPRFSPSSASSGRSSSRARAGASSVDAAGRWRVPVGPNRGRAAAAGADGLVALGGGSAIDTAQGGLGRDGPAARLDPDDLLRRGVDASSSGSAIPTSG